MPDALLPLVVSTRRPGERRGRSSTASIADAQVLKDLKSPTNCGWDWGTNIWTLGIWKDVRLEATGPARIDWTRVQTDLADDYAEGHGHRHAGNRQPRRRAGRGPLPCVRATARRRAATVRRRAEQGHESGRRRSCRCASRPCGGRNGQGEQPLYTLRAEIQPAGRRSRRSTPAATRFGVRDVRWVHTRGRAGRFRQPLPTGHQRPAGAHDGLEPDPARPALRPDGAARAATAAPGEGRRHEHAPAVGRRRDPARRGLRPGRRTGHHARRRSCRWPTACRNRRRVPRNLEATARNIVKQVRNHPSIIEFDGGNEMPWNSTTKHPALQLLQKIVRRGGRPAVPRDLPRPAVPRTALGISTTCRRTAALYDHARTDAGRRVRHRVAGQPGGLAARHPAEVAMADRRRGRADPDPQEHRPGRVRADYWLRKSLTWTRSSDRSTTCRTWCRRASSSAPRACATPWTPSAARQAARRPDHWDFNEPWTNGAGSYLVDYDGRPLMNYDFVKQALAPLSLSLQVRFAVLRARGGHQGRNCFSPATRRSRPTDLRWKWLARDRAGGVRPAKATASIEPLEVKSLGDDRA